MNVPEGASWSRGGAGAAAPATVAHPHPRNVARRLGSVSALGAVLGGLATWYGYLEAAHGHPSLKLGGAMALAGSGTAALLVGKPADHPSDSHLHEHSALVSLHPLRLTLAWLSMSAALVHFAVIQQHFEEYWLYGVFFIAVAMAQLAWAIAVVVRPFPMLLLAGTAGNALVALTWVITRTVGLLVGPSALETEAAGFGDIVSTLFEVAIVVGAIVLWRSRRLGEPIRPHRGEVINALVAIGVTLLTVLALYSSVEGTPFVTHVG